jgi:lipid-A-disaccharide synthase-like uncharacterized protein
MTAERLWLTLGLVGQSMFTMRFLVQWVQSERRRRSVTPVAFWYLSLGGGIVLLLYALHRHDIVFTLGQATGLAVYARNLHLIARERRRASGPDAGVARE